MAIKVINYDNKSSVMLNAIRDGATEDYKSRIPVATSDNLNKVQTAIYQYESTYNEYARAVIDKLGFTDIDNMTFTNDLARLKQASYSMGKDGEEIFVGLIKSLNYNLDTAPADLFKKYESEIMSVYHTLNRTSVYPLTIAEDILTRAFQSEDSFGSMMGALMQSMETSDEVDEFLLMKNVINGAIVEGKVSQVTVQPVVDEQTAKDLTVKIKEISDLWKFPRNNYNFANVMQTCPKERQVLLINTRVKSRMNVEVLATAFNMDKANIDTLQITMDDFGQASEKVVAMLIDERWLKVKDRLRMRKQVENQIGLSWNYFYHVHQMLSSSPFYNAMIFIESTPTLTAIDLKPDVATVEKGGALAFVTEATGTNNPPSKCDFTVNGASSSTKILPTGLLYVGYDETTTPLTVTATSTFDGITLDTATITII